MAPRNINARRGRQGSSTRISLNLIFYSFISIAVLFAVLQYYFIFTGDRSSRTLRALESKSLQDVTPPESLTEIEFCAEKCRYIPAMCTENLYRDQLGLPAPTCLRYSTTVEDDIYWASFRSQEKELNTNRDKKTAQLVMWAASRARERRVHGKSTELKCEEVPTENMSPMMWPEEL